MLAITALIDVPAYYDQETGVMANHLTRKGNSGKTLQPTVNHGLESLSSRNLLVQRSMLRLKDLMQLSRTMRLFPRGLTRLLLLLTLSN